ncbi:MAG: Rieske (2Fe-2S) protein [Vicinamibacteria bacterium]|jgi:nitrite reductase/ring-hydroxylating ferredoxin subunit
MSRAVDGSRGLVRIASLARVPPGAALARTVGGYTIAVFNVDGLLLALDDSCLRCCASLAAATPGAAGVRCRCGFDYDLTTGAVRGVARLHTGRYDVNVDGDDICVAIPALLGP